MRKYDVRVERDIRVERLAHEWAKSGWIEPAQRDRILADISIDLRRTNLFLRWLLFGFTLLIIAAASILVAIVIKPHTNEAVAFLCFFAAGVVIVLAEILSAADLRLYRFGVEEAAAVSAVLLAGIGAFVASDKVIVGLGVAAAMGFVVYARFGYVYAAVGAMLCASAMPFQIRWLAEDWRRVTAAAVLACIWFIGRQGRRRYEDEFPGDEYSLIEAAAWVLIYLFLNLHLGWRLLPGTTGAAAIPIFYWFTYAMTWLLPAMGLILAIKEKHRLMLDVNLAMALATLTTNKPYLHGVQRPWDPIVFGVLLIGVAAAVRRLLDRGPKGVRNGFTAARLLDSDRRNIALAGTASVLFQPDSARSTTEQDGFKPQGGRSGGAGASGSF